MPKLSLLAFIALTAACSTDSLAPSETSSGSSKPGSGRMMCGATATDQTHVAGCTDSDLLSATHAGLSMRVVRSGLNLRIDLQSASGDSWSGVAVLRVPTGGTGTRARVFTQAPSFPVISCDTDSLLRCPRP